MIRRTMLFIFLVSLASGLLVGCSGTDASTTSTSAEHELTMAPMSQMSTEVRNAPAVTQRAYQFAVANPEVMKQIPCYCGCGAMGHTSNYTCYVQSAEASGKITFDTHALGCSICVDITQDTMRLLRQGTNVKDIRAYVDKTYSQYGPSNIQ